MKRWRAEPKADEGKAGAAAAGITAFLTSEEMHTLGRLALRSRSVVEGNLAGAHRSPFKGPSSEFADHKAYGLGDDPKHIDWRVLGRTDKYYIKRFEDETNLRVYLALDRINRRIEAAVPPDDSGKPSPPIAGATEGVQ